jgi:hypothetical protein
LCKNRLVALPMRYSFLKQNEELDYEALNILKYAEVLEILTLRRINITVYV